MRFFPVLFLLLAACPCPDFAGEDDELSFRTCANPAEPLLRGSSWSVEQSPDGEAPITNWSTVGTAIGVSDTEDGARLTAAEVGQAQLVAIDDDGRTDFLIYEVVDGRSGRWRDSLMATIDDVVEDDPDSIVGTPASSDPTERILLAPGGTAEMTLEVRSEDGRLVQWSNGALEVTGGVLDGGSSWIVSEAGTLAARQVDGDELESMEVAVAGGLSGVDLNISAWAPERPDDGTEYTAYIRAVALVDGEPLQGASFVWKHLGDGTLSGWGEDDEGEPSRYDLAGLTLEDEPEANVCVVTELETDDGWIGASVWLTPDGGSVHDDTTCGGQGCGCAVLDRRAAPTLLLLLLLLPRRRRR